MSPYLKMAVQRIQIHKNKKTQQNSREKREVAKLLAANPRPKEEKARIRCEGIIREDFLIEAYEIIELLCELVSQRLAMIENEKECPFDMKETIHTLIYAANRTTIPELHKIKTLFQKKYGKSFIQKAMSNSEGKVNKRIIEKLTCDAPNSFMVVNYMKTIVKEYEVDWTPSPELMENCNRIDVPMPGPTGQSVLPGQGSGITQPYQYNNGVIQKGQTKGVPMAQTIPNAPSNSDFLPQQYQQPTHISTSTFNIPTAPTTPVNFQMNHPGNNINGSNNFNNNIPGGNQNPNSANDSVSFDNIQARFQNLNNNSGGGSGGVSTSDLEARFRNLSKND